MDLEALEDHDDKEVVRLPAHAQKWCGYPQVKLPQFTHLVLSALICL